MTERVTAADRLARILYLLPAAAREDGVPIAELAAALGVSERDVLADVTEVTSREFYHPAGSVADVTMTVERGRLHVRTTGAFQRPVRLSPREALALGLGLRALAAEVLPERRAELIALATRLEARLAAPVLDADAFPDAIMEPRDAYDAYHGARVPPRAPGEPREGDRFGRADRVPRPPHAPDLDRFATVFADGEEDILSVAVEAARERRVCRIVYLKPGAASPEARVIHPYTLVHAEGRWYLLAHSVERDDIRIFRIDRILAAEAMPETFDVAADFDPARYIAEGGRLFAGEDDIEVVVRYSPRISRWVEERTACERLDDGSVVVRHRVADARWVVRHVLQYGADAVVIEPAEVRGWICDAAGRLVN